MGSFPAFLSSDLGFQHDGSAPAPGRWSEGASMDRKGTFTSMPLAPMGEKPVPGPAKPDSGTQTEQIRREGGGHFPVSFMIRR
jgi:hypothetical protein